MNILALSNVVFAQGGNADQYGGNFGHLMRSDEDGDDEDGNDGYGGPATGQVKLKLNQNKLLSSQYSNLLEGSSENFAGLERQRMDEDDEHFGIGDLGSSQDQQTQASATNQGKQHT